jgi:hypothetical protein
VISGTETQLWRIALDSEFEDVNGHVFRKTGATRLGLSFGDRKIKKHKTVCLASPFTNENPPGPNPTSAFLKSDLDFMRLGGRVK